MMKMTLLVELERCATGLWRRNGISTLRRLPACAAIGVQCK